MKRFALTICLAACLMFALGSIAFASSVVVDSKSSYEGSPDNAGIYLQNEGGITELDTPGTGSGTSSVTEAPSPAVRWPDEKIRRALASVARE